MTKDEIQQAILDALGQHASYTSRLSSANVNEIIKQFDTFSNAQIRELQEILENLSSAELSALASAKYTTPALKEFKSTMDEWMTQITAQLQPLFVESAVALAAYEASYIYRLADKEAPAINGKSIYNQAKDTPYGGGLIVDQIFPNISDQLRKNVEETIRDGINQSQTTQQIVNRIKGTKALDYNDGILDTTRKDITTEVRTARSHVSNISYESVYKALGVEYVKFLATLDGRTSPICVYNSDKIHPTNKPHPTPPLHRNCRSVLIPCDKDGDIEGMRPFVASDKPVSKIPKDQRQGVIGQVDANTTYVDWFSRQSAGFQKDWLGVRLYEKWKANDLPITRFIDPLNGRKFTIAQLEEADNKTFKQLKL